MSEDELAFAAYWKKRKDTVEGDESSDSENLHELTIEDMKKYLAEHEEPPAAASSAAAAAA